MWPFKIVLFPDVNIKNDSGSRQKGVLYKVFSYSTYLLRSTENKAKEPVKLEGCWMKWVISMYVWEVKIMSIWRIVNDRFLTWKYLYSTHREIIHVETYRKLTVLGKKLTEWIFHHTNATKLELMLIGFIEWRVSL